MKHSFKLDRGMKILSALMILALMVGSLTGCSKDNGEAPLEGWEIDVMNGDLEIQEAATPGEGQEKWETEDNTPSKIVETEESKEESQEESEEVAEEVNEDQEESLEESAAEAAEESTQEETEDSQEEAAEESQVIPVQTARFINPLTGEGVESDMAMERPYVVVTNNHFYAYPLVGIAGADIVMEFLMESGFTRYALLYMPEDLPETIGSIQGTKTFPVEMAMAYDALLVHCGGDRMGLNRIYGNQMESLDAVMNDHLNGTFTWDLSKQVHGTEYSLFADSAQILASVENNGFRQEHEAGFDTTYGMQFSANAANQCTEDAPSVHVTFANEKTSDFTYDAQLGGYTLKQFDQELVDDNGTTLIFANVLNLYVNTWVGADGVNYDMELTEGEGTFFTGGKAVAIHWTKDGSSDAFHFTLEDGTPLEMSIGKTYMCINQNGNNRLQGSCTW